MIISATVFITGFTHYASTNTVSAPKDTGILEWDRQQWLRALVNFTKDNMSMTSDPMV